jgi:hypothetical protein
LTNEGPTVAGSIVAKLTIDTAEWDAKIAAVKAAARDLGAIDPDIQVHADTAAAMTKLEAVEGAARRLGAQNDRLRVSMDGVNNTNQAGLQRWQMMALLIGSLIPLLAPLAGYAVGVAGALAGMGAAGALAIYGIVKALGSGTAAGGQWQVSLNQLKATLDSLGQTAANAMLGSFNQAVRAINAALPELNSQIRTFSQILGVAGNAALAGVINALHILNPLFTEASKYVLDLAKGFQSWTTSGALEKFANYAMTQLPVVADTLGSLAQAALHIAQAFAPMGTVVLGVLTLLGDAINGIPLDVLMNLGTAAAAAFAGFKLWSTLQPILIGVADAIGAVGVATQLAEGPIGWITAGVSALAAVLAVNVAATNDASQAASEFANALREDNDAIGANVRATAAKKLQDAGILDAAEKARISTKLVTDATLGDTAAKKQLGQQIDQIRNKIQTQAGQTQQLTQEQQRQLDATEKVANGTSSLNKEIQDSITTSRQLDSAIGASNGQLVSNAGLMQALTDATGKAADATDELSKKLKGLGQVNLDASQANIQYNASVADAAASVKQYGQGLDVTTEAGRQNMSALNGIASAATSLIAAQAKAGTSTSELTSNMGAARQAFMNAAMAAGASASQAAELADKYGLIPKNVSTAVQVTGADAAKQKVQELQSWIDALHGKTVTIQAIANTGTAGHLYGFANGGTIPPAIHAAGGLTVHGAGSSSVDSVPAVLAPGEEVISNRNGQASFWRSALKMMNSGNRLGVAQEVARLVGSRGASPRITAPTVIHNHTWNVTASDPTELTQKVAMRLSTMGRI